VACSSGSSSAMESSPAPMPSTTLARKDIIGSS
jgi:hypothetical protein